MNQLLVDSPLFRNEERQCGRTTKMTYEHIPPRSSGNASPAKPITMKSFLESKKQYPWDKGIKYKNQQAGIGVYSLCKDCNNRTGEWYGAEYAGWVARAKNMLITNDINDYGHVRFEEVYPQRFLKQVLSMFCSINPQADIADLRAYVLDKEATKIDRSKYRVMMFFTKSQTRRMYGFTALAKSPEKCVLFSEIVAYPFGFALFIDPEDETEGDWFDITPLANCTYSQQCNVLLPLMLQEVNGFFIGDYRSMEEIVNEVESE